VLRRICALTATERVDYNREFALQGTGRDEMILAQSKAIRTVLRWQVMAAAAMALLLGLLSGAHGAISAALGGLVSICAGLAFSVVVSSSKSDSLGATLVTALRAEAVKIAVAVVLLWLVFATYRNVVPIAFVGSFALSILIFGMAFFVRDATHPAREGSD
jgi:ATP synthase protein I